MPVPSMKIFMTPLIVMYFLYHMQLKALSQGAEEGEYVSDDPRGFSYVYEDPFSVSFHKIFSQVLFPMLGMLSLSHATLCGIHNIIRVVYAFADL